MRGLRKRHGSGLMLLAVYATTVATLVPALVPGISKASSAERDGALRAEARFDQPPTVVRDWEDNWGLGEPSVAINPRDPDNIIVGTNDHNYPDTAWGLGIYVSDDRGRTWSNRGFIDIAGAVGEKYAWGADPSVVFDARGVAYYSGLALGVKRGGIAVISSRNGGKTWSKPVMAVTHRTKESGRCYGSDKEYMAVDSPRRILYMVYTRARRDECNNKGIQWPYIDGSPIALVKSTDGGKTWTKPSLVSENPDANALGAVPVVAPNGTLYVAYKEEKEGVDTCPNTRSALWGTPVGEVMVIAVSKDGGETWRRREIEPFCAHDYFLRRPFSPGAKVNSNPTLSVDPTTGIAYLAWSNSDLPLPGIHVLTSRSDGRDWDEVSVVSDDGREAHLPWLVARDGVLRLIYKSMVGLEFRAHYRESFDGGKTWTDPVALDEAPACDGCPAADDDDHGHSGDYWNLDARCGVIVAAWGDYGDDMGISNVVTRVGSYETQERC